MTKNVIPPELRCCGQVRLPGRVGWGNHTVRCQRRGVVEREGKFFCRQHDPEAAKARREKRSGVLMLRAKLHDAESKRHAAELDVLLTVRQRLMHTEKFSKYVAKLLAADAAVEDARQKLDLFKLSDDGGE